MNILAIETSTEACSAAMLRTDGALFSEFEIAPRQHTRLLPAMMDAVIAAAAISRQSIDYCAFANGPGAFTGIRIAAAQAQGIAIALGIPVIAISTLAVLAQASLDKFSSTKTLVALDARMAEIYWASYGRDEDGCASLIGSEALTSADQIIIDNETDCGAGHGWALPELQHRAPSGFVFDAQLLPDAASLLKLARVAAERGRVLPANRVSINYLRNQVAVKSAG